MVGLGGLEPPTVRESLITIPRNPHTDLALIRGIYGAICIVSNLLGNLASLHQRLGESGFRTTATWIGAIKLKPYWMSIGRRRMARLGCGEECTGNRSPIGRAAS